MNNVEVTKSKKHILKVWPADGYVYELFDLDGKLIVRGWAEDKWTARVTGHAAVSHLEQEKTMVD